MMLLTAQQYEQVIAEGLRQLGLDANAVAALLASRWPMAGYGVLSECAGRGLMLTLDDVQAYLEHVCKGPTWHDGEPIDAAVTWFSPAIVESMLAWCIEHGRGCPSFSGDIAEHHPHVLDAVLDRANHPNN